MAFIGQRRLNNLQLTLLVIGEVVPVQAMKKYGGMKVYVHAFLISTLGRSSKLLASPALPPQKEPSLPSKWKTLWARETIRAICSRENFLLLQGIETQFPKPPVHSLLNILAEL